MLINLKEVFFFDLYLFCHVMTFRAVKVNSAFLILHPFNTFYIKYIFILPRFHLTIEGLANISTEFNEFAGR